MELVKAEMAGRKNKWRHPRGARHAAAFTIMTADTADGMHDRHR